MKEDLLYFIWKFKLYEDYRLCDIDYSRITVLNPGIQNINSGPDFIGTQLKTEKLTWVGNIEIDVKSSDWYRHGHHLNKEFNNVILEVVNKYDKQVFCENGRQVPVLEIEVKKCIVDKYNQYIDSKQFIPCNLDIGNVDPLKIQIWLAKVLAGRLSEKADQITGILEQYKNSWEETFYILLARNFGFNVNADPFEWLAKSIPLKCFAKHQSNLMQIEALLFGQAGFLEETLPNNIYYNTLKDEYQFLKSKYQLKPIEKYLWKFMRIRPTNFPTIRISQFANLIYRSSSLFSKILQTDGVDELKLFFDVEASGFWKNHYQFGTETKLINKSLGSQSIDKIIINTIVPILFVYAGMTGDELIKERALSYLEKIKPEKNNITSKWAELGIEIPNAFSSQALLQQKKAYCSNAKCLECAIGVEILKKLVD